MTDRSRWIAPTELDSRKAASSIRESAWQRFRLQLWAIWTRAGLDMCGIGNHGGQSAGRLLRPNILVWVRSFPERARPAVWLQLRAIRSRAKFDPCVVDDHRCQSVGSPRPPAGGTRWTSALTHLLARGRESRVEILLRARPSKFFSGLDLRLDLPSVRTTTPASRLHAPAHLSTTEAKLSYSDPCGIRTFARERLLICERVLLINMRVDGTNHERVVPYDFWVAPSRSTVHARAVSASPPPA